MAKSKSSGVSLESFAAFDVLGRYRLILLPLGKPQAPWRLTRREAVADAVDAGLATKDEFEPDQFWWHPLAEIEEDEE